jgi:hypothetical protein
VIARIVLAVAALGTVAAAPPGPSASEFNALRTATGEPCPGIRKLSCAVLGDGTEFKCSYEEHFPRKHWTPSTALVGRNGTGWDWLDGGPRCSPLPQH